MQVLNPRGALFFLAFLPQLVDPSRSDAWTQILVLGATLAALGLLTDGLYPLLKGTAGAASGGEAVGSMVRSGTCSPLIYLALGAARAASGSGKD